MKHLLYLREEAEQDLEEARQWYEKRSAGLGAEFIDIVRLQIQKIVDFPESFNLCHASVRGVTMPRFPYVIYYQVLPDMVEVLAVVHARRSAKSWKQRLSKN